jgi:hypothetical protein
MAELVSSVVVLVVVVFTRPRTRALMRRAIADAVLMRYVVLVCY